MATMRHVARRIHLSAIPPLAWLSAFMALPVIVLFAAHVELADVTRVLSRESTWRTSWFAVWMAATSVLITFAVAMPATWLVGRFEFRGRASIRAVASVGFLLPSVVVSAAFLALLPERVETSMFAVLLAHAYFNIAVVMRVVSPRLETFDTQLVWAARTLGAGTSRTITSIWWPAVRGAVVSAATVVFIYCFTSYAVVRTLGGPTLNTLESEIAVRAYAIGDVGGAAVLSALQAALICVVVVLARCLARDKELGLRRTRSSLARLTGRRRVVGACIIFGTLLAVMCPIFALLVSSMRVGNQWSLGGWRAVISDDVIGSTSPLRALWSSFRTAAIAGMLGIVLAISMSLAIIRLGVGGRWLDAIAVSPLLISPVTLGLGLIVTFDESWYDWRGEWWFVAVVHSIVAFPLAVRSLVPSWRNVTPRLRDAAAVLGASPTRRLFDVDLRLVRPAVVAAVGLIVAVSLGEFGAASMLSRSGAETLPVAIARLLGRTGDTVRSQAFVLATLLVFACLAALLVVDVGGRQSRRPVKEPHAQRR